MPSYWGTFNVWLNICRKKEAPQTEWIFKWSNWRHFPPSLPNGLLNYMWQCRQDLSLCSRVHLAAIISNISRIHWARSRRSHACCSRDLPDASQGSLYLVLLVEGLHPVVHYSCVNPPPMLNNDSLGMWALVCNFFGSFSLILSHNMFFFPHLLPPSLDSWTVLLVLWVFHFHDIQYDWFF